MTFFQQKNLQQFANAQLTNRQMLHLKGGNGGGADDGGNCGDDDDDIVITDIISA